MKKIYQLSIVCFAIINTVTAQSIKVPSAAEKSFLQKFPAAKEIKWEKENKNEYEAGFTLNGKKGSANFSTTGEWLETEMEIASSALPKNMLQDFQKKYPGATINEVYSIETKDGKHYFEVEYNLKGKKHEAKLNP